MKSLEERLHNWTDWDGAAYEVGVHLGLWKEFGLPQDVIGDHWHGLKHIMWSNNLLGNMLYQLLLTLVSEGVLISRDDNEQFKWNPDFKEIK